MMDSVIYKIRRTDNLEYIGIAKNFNSRLYQHEHSERFESGIQEVKILFSGEYDECFDLEEFFIRKHDTYNRGLNKTPHGKGWSNSKNFTTLGMKFSEETKRKIGEKSKDRKTMLGKKHSEETKRKYSEYRKNRQHSTKLSSEQYDELIEIYRSRPELDKNRIAPSIKKSQRDDYLNGNIDLNKCKSLNGKSKSYEREFSIEYAPLYSITPTSAYNIIMGKSWSENVIRK